MIDMSKKALSGFLTLPEARDIEDIDNASTVALHRRVIRKNRLLRELYRDFYHQLRKQCKDTPPGPRIEIGSGAGFIKDIMPDVITSDVVACGLDMVVNAEKMPFADDSISTLLLMNVLHHIPDQESFLREAERCLKPGGKIVMIEPGNSPVRRFVCRYFHHEPFVNDRPEWRLPSSGRLSVSNQAIPWMIFIRDRNRFEQRFPRLKVIRIKKHTPFRYFLSGGLSKRQMVPSFSSGTVKLIEWLLNPLNGIIGSFMTVVIEKEVSDEV